MSFRKVTACIFALFLKLWATILAIIVPTYRIPQAPESFLRFLFHNKRLEILEYLSDIYFPFGVFRYENKIYILDPKISMKIINKLDKGAHDYLSQSPLNNSFLGATHKSPETRHVIAALFRKANMEQNDGQMVEVIKKTVEKMKKKKIVNVSQISLRMALDIVGKVLLKLDLGALDGKQETFVEAMMTILHRFYALGEVEAGSKELTRAFDNVDQAVREILTQALNKSETERSLPQLLREAGGFEEAVDNLKLFLMAGSETTASSIPVLLYLIANSQNLQNELQEEADEYITKVTSDGSCTPPKLESATKELLRTYAIAPYISRRTNEALEVDHVTLPAESDLRIFTWGIHRSQTLYDDSKVFKPFRFLHNDSLKHHQAHSFIPFGAGSRICIGQHLAWVELRLALTYFLHFFLFTPSNQTKDLSFCVDWEHAVVHPDEDVVLGISLRQ